MRALSVLLIALFSTWAAADPLVPPAGVPGLPDPLECGHYEISGRLGGSASTASFIEVYAGTTRRFELPLRQLDTEDELSFSGRDVKVEVYITQPGSGAEALARVLGRAKLITQKEALAHPIRLLAQMKCSAIPKPGAK